MTGLNGRVSKLEATLKPSTNHCRACGLRHASGKQTLDVLRGIFRVDGGTDAAPTVRIPLCLCDPCCGDPRARWLARMSHGMV